MDNPVRLVTRLSAQLLTPRTKHYEGMGDGVDSGRLMPRPTLLAIEQRPDGIFLYRYTGGGEFAGDTWHATLDEAKEQARFEFGELFTDWISVPPHIQDIVSFGLAGSEHEKKP